MDNNGEKRTSDGESMTTAAGVCSRGGSSFVGGTLRCSDEHWLHAYAYAHAALNKKKEG